MQIFLQKRNTAAQAAKATEAKVASESDNSPQSPAAHLQADNSSPTTTEPKKKLIKVSTLDNEDELPQTKAKKQAGTSAEVAVDVSKHSQEMSDRLRNLTQTIQENKKEEEKHFEALSIEQRSSRLEEEFIGKASKARQELPITRICVTGGPCAGKTTALAELSLVLKQLGYRVLVVPEAMMILKKGGVSIDTKSMTFI